MTVLVVVFVCASLVLWLRYLGHVYIGQVIDLVSARRRLGVTAKERDWMTAWHSTLVLVVVGLVFSSVRAVGQFDEALDAAADRAETALVELLDEYRRGRKD